jgi:hypothetical protein
MYLVNTTFAVEPSVHSRWLDIIKGHYIPLLEHKGYEVVALSRVISVDTVHHFTWSLLVAVPDMPSYAELTGKIFDEYLAVADPLFGESVVWFTSLMKIENIKNANTI